ncbi:glycine--tRNA ligase subunit beta [Brumicola pallidula]|uniref:Glycine--tRNA ligase beta subunit n=1 Tax=Brumicola pallidula DSM 14239 = ACAM 615 TaxID=1121922 RepID=K6Y263_9ALTE|nr:glycine--tRNA ligase subunit beta [Glaciecola pallidula]GAC26909.1 glycyl-tRNA synthetase beta chain [Glaciecola pallidula DSM 14239 = ACAM 615]
MTVIKENLLIELGTEELPPKSLKKLSESFTQNMHDELSKSGFEFDSIASYAAPRRLAVVVKNCAGTQPDSHVEKRGPAVSSAFDADGNATRAAQGWAKGNGIDVAQASRLKTDKGEWLLYVAEVKGKALKDVLQDVLQTAVNKLPISKPMRWGLSSAEFIRPVHTLCVMFGDEVLTVSLFGLRSANQLSGHRFHGQHRFTLAHADNYASALTAQYVIADYAQRTNTIEAALKAKAKELGLRPDYDRALLEEISSLVEWPVILSAKFEADFLDVPKEALIYTMKDDQKYVPLLSADGQLSSHFLFVSNIESKDPIQVIEGNQKVIRPRLADAKFFFETDKKTTLASKAEKLASVLFQKELGTVAEKTARLVAISQSIAKALDMDPTHVSRAAALAKADLLSDMVMEFPSVQGIMGHHYALHDGEHAAVGLAIEEQYLPRFAGDKLPTSTAGYVLALAEKLDTLVGIFGIGKLPKGDKDPFALRRSAIGILRILVENSLPLDLQKMVDSVVSIYADKLSNTQTATQVHMFLLDRFKPFYQDQDISGDVVSAVMTQQPTTAIDFDARIKAVTAFKKMDSAVDLVAANKRVANILNKNAIDIDALPSINPALFSEDAEKALFSALESAQSDVTQLIETLSYDQVLASLTVLKTPLNNFFDDVMIMTDDELVKSNRVALVGKARQLFLSVADVSVLAV